MQGPALVQVVALPLIIMDHLVHKHQVQEVDKVMDKEIMEEAALEVEVDLVQAVHLLLEVIPMPMLVEVDLALVKEVEEVMEEVVVEDKVGRCAHVW